MTHISPENTIDKECKELGINVTIEPDFWRIRVIFDTIDDKHLYTLIGTVKPIDGLIWFQVI